MFIFITVHVRFICKQPSKSALYQNKCDTNYIELYCFNQNPVIRIQVISSDIGSKMGHVIGSNFGTIFIFEPPHDKTNKMMCTQRRLKSAWASAQSDQSLGHTGNFVGFVMWQLIFGCAWVSLSLQTGEQVNLS